MAPPVRRVCTRRGGVSWFVGRSSWLVVGEPLHSYSTPIPPSGQCDSRGRPREPSRAGPGRTVRLGSPDLLQRRCAVKFAEMTFPLLRQVRRDACVVVL